MPARLNPAFPGCAGAVTFRASWSRGGWPKALTAVIQEACVHGVSTRAVNDLVQAMGASGVRKSQVSRLCRELDERVGAFLDRPIEGYRPRLDRHRIRRGRRGPQAVAHRGRPAPPPRARARCPDEQRRSRRAGVHAVARGTPRAPGSTARTPSSAWPESSGARTSVVMAPAGEASKACAASAGQPRPCCRRRWSDAPRCRVRRRRDR